MFAVALRINFEKLQRPFVVEQTISSFYVCCLQIIAEQFQFRFHCNGRVGLILTELKRRFAGKLVCSVQDEQPTVFDLK